MPQDGDIDDHVSTIRCFRVRVCRFRKIDFTPPIAYLHCLRNVCKQRDVQPGEVLCESRTIDERLLMFVKGKSAGGEKLLALTPVRFDQAFGAGVRHSAQPEAFLCFLGVAEAFS